MIDDLELCIFNFDAFGKTFLKTQKVSPDAFFNLSLQLAFYRFNNLYKYN